ncbi:MAG: hypothetical protein RL115_352 [Bacteroidota bacterium]|jgi:hypothetical protein
MKYSTWIGVIAALLLIFSCFMPWVIIESQQITISGINTSGTRFGKPGYLHFVLALLYILFTLIPKLWAKRANLPVVAINTAWVIRNFFLIAVCRGGECPSRQWGLWLMLLASIIMLVAALFPKMDIPTKNEPF